MRMLLLLLVVGRLWKNAKRRHLNNPDVQEMADATLGYLKIFATATCVTRLMGN
jgi:hypothetical protein